MSPVLFNDERFFVRNLLHASFRVIRECQSKLAIRVAKGELIRVRVSMAVRLIRSAVTPVIVNICANCNRRE